MAENNNAERVYRFIVGNISRVNVGKKDKFDKHSLLIDGAYKDTNEPFSGFLSTGGAVKVFKSGEADPVDPSTIDGKKFQGQVYVCETVYEDQPDKTWKFLNAVSIEGPVTDDDAAQQDDSNPFLDNPIM